MGVHAFALTKSLLSPQVRWEEASRIPGRPILPSRASPRCLVSIQLSRIPTPDPPLPVRSPERVPERASSCRKPRSRQPLLKSRVHHSSSLEPLVPCPASSAGRAQHRAPDPDIPRPVPPPSRPAPGLSGVSPDAKIPPQPSARTMPARALP